MDRWSRTGPGQRVRTAAWPQSSWHPWPCCSPHLCLPPPLTCSAEQRSNHHHRRPSSRLRVPTPLPRHPHQLLPLASLRRACRQHPVAAPATQRCPALRSVRQRLWESSAARRESGPFQTCTPNQNHGIIHEKSGRRMDACVRGLIATDTRA